MIGNRLKQLREEKGLKQEELAKQLSIAPSTIGMYETNKREPNNEITIKIANFFKVSTDYLLGKSDIKNAQIDDNKTPIIRKIERGAKKLNDKEQEKAYKMLKIAFEDAFRETPDDT